jgi:hypothetical protein
MTALWLMVALLTKHFILDFPLQLKYMLDEKGSYLAVGGLHHAGLHGLATALVFALFGFTDIAPVMGILDALIHYHIDYLKVYLGKLNSWDPSKKVFWTALGVDQYAHHMTYVLLIVLALHK